MSTYKVNNEPLTQLGSQTLIVHSDVNTPSGNITFGNTGRYLVSITLIFQQNGNAGQDHPCYYGLQSNNNMYLINAIGYTFQGYVITSGYIVRDGTSPDNIWSISMQQKVYNNTFCYPNETIINMYIDVTNINNVLTISFDYGNSQYSKAMYYYTKTFIG